MKNIIKITRLLLLFALCNHAFSQDKMETVTLKKHRTSVFSNTGTIPIYRIPYSINSASRIGGALLSEDFGGGDVPAGWEAIDNTGQGPWKWSEGAQNGITFNSTTFANGCMIVDSDSAGAGMVQDAELITPPLNCTGITAIHLKFQDVFAQFGTSLGEVFVSSDKITWNSIYTVGPGIPQDQASENPGIHDIDISATAANQPTVYIKFKYTGAYDYWWMIDDFEVFESASLDASVSAIISPVSSCDLTNLETVSISIFNNGTSFISNFDVTYSINGNTPIIENVGTLTLAPGETQNFTFSTLADLSQLSQYSINASTQLVGDGDNTNDSSTAFVQDYLTAIGDTLYNNFDNPDLSAGWQIEDTDGDARTWFTGDAGGNIVMAILGSTTATTNDWFFSNCIYMESGKNYTLTFKHMESKAGNFNLEVFLGNAQNSTAMNIPVVVVTNLTPNDSLIAISIDLTGPGSGVYYFGFYGYGAAQSGNTEYLVVDDVQCNEIAPLVPPIADFTTSKTNVCVGDNVNFTDLSQNSPASYLWSFPGGNPSSSTLKNPVVTYSATGQYDVTLKVTNSGGTDTKIQTQYINVMAVSVNSTITSLLCAGGNNGQIVAVGSDGTVPYSYSWNNNSNTSTITNLMAGNYTVTVTDANGCKTQAVYTITEPSPMALSFTSGNVLCNNGATGSAMASVNGGTSSYSYNWSNGVSVATNTNLVSGLYAVTITDNNSCITTGSVTITQPSSVSVALSSVNPTCPGMADGSVQASVLGGVSPYIYQWSNGGATPQINGLTDGGYQLTVTDFNNCTSTASVDIQSGNTINTQVNTIDLLCAGNSNGAIDLLVTGGNPPYNYQWSNGQAKEDINNLAAGIYTCTITDSKGCSYQSLASIAEPAGLTFTMTQFNTSSCGTSDGQASVNVTGGIPPYTYLWNNGVTVKSISGLSAGSYVVTITDANSCTKTASASISNPGAQTVSISATNVSCNGGTDGNISTTISGGTLPYTFSWSNGSTNQNLSNLPGGNYAMTVVDAVGCVVTQNVDVINPSAVSIILFTSQSNCGGENAGGIIAVTSGGISPYIYAWSNLAITSTINNLSPGMYSLTVTDAKGCQNTSSASLLEPAPLTISLNKIDINCGGTSTGSAIVSVSGGTVPYFYNWSNLSMGSSTDFLSAGTYTVTVTDQNGCFKTQNTVITEPAPIGVSASSVNLTCSGINTGSATVNVTGGVSPYNYMWSDGFTGNLNNNLFAGNYQCTVTDLSGCTKTTQFTITEPTALLLSLNSTNPTSCGLTNGSATAIVSGGIVPYQYAWSTGATPSSISSIPAGTYSVTLTDANSCTKSSSVSISDPGAPTVILTVTNVTCNGATNGSINASVSGGTLPYTYLWMPGSITTQNLNGIGSGNYSLVITDATGCKVSSNANVLAPASITLNFMAVSPNCNGDINGTVDVNVQGGNIPYSFAWSTGNTTNGLVNVSTGIYTLTITDSKGCIGIDSVAVNEPLLLNLSISSTNVDCFGNNSGTTDAQISGGVAPYNYVWSNGSSFPSQTGLPAGNYSVTVTDNNGCFTDTSVTISSSSLINIDVLTTDILCFGASTGNVDITVSGGAPGYSYQWSNGFTSEDLNGAGAGNYFIVVTDSNGCTMSTSVTLSEPLQISVTLTAINPSSCGVNDGTIASLVSGGIPPYLFSWITGEVTDSIMGLSTGNYSLTVTDTTGCSNTGYASLSDLGAPTLSINATPELCIGSGDGTATATASGGILPYTFIWSTTDTSSSLQGLIPGFYFLTVSDSSGCKSSVLAEITSPEPLLISFLVDSAKNGNDGAIDLTVTGGTAPYLYNWSTGEITEDITGLNAGDFTVIVSDMNNCKDSATINVPLKTFINIAETSTAIQIFPNPFGKEIWYRLPVIKTGEYYLLKILNGQGKQVMNFQISSASGKLEISNLPSGVYLFELKDKGGRTTRWKAVKGK